MRTLAFLLKVEHLIVKNWSRNYTPAVKDKMDDLLKLGQAGVMPASFKDYYRNPPQKTEISHAEFGETAIERAALMDSGLWWIILLRAYTKWTGNNSLAESPNFQRAMHLILKLSLSEGCDTSPAFCADGCSMIDRRMSIYDYPIEIQDLFFVACVPSLFKQDSDIEFVNRITKRIQPLYHLLSYYWFDLKRVNDIYSCNTEEYSHTTLSKFSAVLKSRPDWIFDFIPSWGGQFIGNISPARMDFHCFCLVNFIAFLSSLPTVEQTQPILDLSEAHWQEHIGEMLLKICYPAMENQEHHQEWHTGCDPKNSKWSYYSTGRYMGKVPHKFKAWSTVSYTVTKMLQEEPYNLVPKELIDDQVMRPASFNHHGKLTQAECLLAGFSERIAALVMSWWWTGKRNLSSLAGSIWQTAICCGLVWILMKLGLDSAYYLDSNSCCLTEAPREAFEALQCLFSTSLFPITDRNVMRLLKIIQEMDVSNRATICIDKSEDGSEEESLRSVQGGVQAIRKWCLKYGLHYDVSDIYGSSLLIFTTPAGGTFYLTIQYKGRLLTLLIAGRNLYIRGWRREQNDSFEIRKHCPSYMLGEVTTVPIAKNYRFLSPDAKVSNTRMGPQALRDAFEALYKCNGESSKDVKQAIGMLAVHFPEAVRIQRVYKTECKSFVTPDHPTLDFRVRGIDDAEPDCTDTKIDDPEPDSMDSNTHWIENYGYHCKEAMRFVEATHSSRQGSRSKEGSVKTSGEDSQSREKSAKIFQEIRVVNRDACLIGRNETKPPQTEDPSDNINRSIVPKRKAEKKSTRKNRVREESTSMIDDEEFLSRFLMQGWHSDSSEEDRDSDEDGEVGVETSSDEEMTSDGQQIQCDQKMTSDHDFADYLSHFTSVGGIIEKRREELVRRMRTMDEWIPSITERRTEELGKSMMRTIDHWISKHDLSANDQLLQNKEPPSQRPQNSLHAPKRLQSRSQNTLRLTAGRFISRVGRFLRLL